MSIIESTAAASTEGNLGAQRDFASTDGRLRARVEVADDEWGDRILRLSVVASDRSADRRFLRVEWRSDTHTQPVECLALLRWEPTMDACYATIRLATSEEDATLSVEGDLAPDEQLLDEEDLNNLAPEILRDARDRDASAEGRQAWDEVFGRLGLTGV